MKAPREIEALMWDVAESGNETAIAQFNARYPEFADELEKRRQMVGNLRGSRPRREVERFVPRQQVRNFGPSRAMVAGVAAVVLFSVTLATYATMQIVNSKRSSAPPVDRPTEIIFNPPTIEAPLSAQGADKDTQPLSADDVQPLTDPSAPAQDVFMGLVTLESEDISLEAAIKAMGDQVGIEVVVAPGFEDKRIRLSFVRQPLIGVLHELGDFFGFSALKDGPAKVLVIPAVPKGGANSVGVPGGASTKPGDPGAEGTGTEKLGTKGGEERVEGEPGV